MLAFHLAPVHRYVDQHDKFVNRVLEAFVLVSLIAYGIHQLYVSQSSSSPSAEANSDEPDREGACRVRFSR